jgi:hypothetical protein
MNLSDVEHDLDIGQQKELQLNDIHEHQKMMNVYVGKNVDLSQ